MLSILKSKPFIFTIAIVVLLQLILAFQGFDVCDDGFVLTFYQQFFNNTESVTYNFLYYTSGIFGGLWYELYPKGGIFWFRILAIIINTASFITAYHILKSYIKKSHLLLGLCIVLFVNNYGFLSFYHNHLTALFCLISILFLKKGFKFEKNVFFIIAGFFIGINALVRLPNIAFCSILLVLIFNYFIQKKSFKYLISTIGFSILGILIGMGSLILFMIANKHLDIMTEALNIIFNLGNTKGSSHNFKDVLLSQFYNYFSICIATIIILILILIISKVLSTLKYKIIAYYLVVLISIMSVILWIHHFQIYAAYALGILGCLSIIFQNKNDSILKLISFMGLITMLVIPLGTGGGVKNAGYITLWIGLPLFFLFLENYENILKTFFKKLKTVVHYKIDRQATIYFVFIVSFLSYKSIRIFNEAYFDKGSRLDKTVKIDNQLANFIYTTKERADIINPVLVALKKYVKKDDYLLVYDHLPMLHFLTQTKPYTYNPWPRIYDYNSFEIKLKKAEKMIPEKPIILQQKFYAIYEFSEPVNDYLSEDREASIHYSIEATKVMNDFLKRHQYEIVWQNEYFNIYKSNL